MEIPFRSQFDTTRWACTMALEPQNLFALSDGDVARLGVQATLKHAPNNPGHIQGLYPIILELHGKLTRRNGLADVGAQLLPVREMPLSLHPSYGAQLVNLHFVISRQYIQLLEEERAKTPPLDIWLTLEMWGTAAMTQIPKEEQHSLVQARQFPGNIVRFERIETDVSAQPIRIERSAWIDRLLPGLGHRRSVLVEIPLMRTPPVPMAYKSAAEALELAHQAFEREDYRSAVKYGREVLEHLGNSSSDGSKSISSFCKEYLQPAIGETKSNAIDASLNSLRKMTSAGSHANSFFIDRAIAAYIIEALALNLRYIGTALQ